MSIITDELEKGIRDNGYDKMILEIEKAADSEILEERCCIAAMLEDYKNKHSEKILIKLLSDESLSVRTNAVQSLALFGSETVFNTLKNLLLTVKSPLLKGSTVLSISYSCPRAERENIIRLFTSMLESEGNIFVRIKLQCALFILGDTNAMKEIMKLYNRYGCSDKCTILNDLADMLERGAGDIEYIKAFSCVAKNNLPHFNVRGAYERLKSVVDSVYGLVADRRPITYAV